MFETVGLKEYEPYLMTHLEPWRELIKSLPVLQRPDGYSAIVVAPHPDDETLGLGGLIYDWNKGGIDVRVLIVSDGRASHQHPQLSHIRQAEALAAADVLGVADRITFLGFPDAELANVCKEISEAIAENLPADGQRCVLLAPRLHDGHSDHDACAIAAAEVAAGFPGVEHWCYGVWTWTHNPQADALVGARRWLISTKGYEAKWKAIDMYASQVTSILGEQIVTPQLLASLANATEVVWC